MCQEKSPSRRAERSPSGRSRGGLPTEAYLICDATECPIRFELTAGQARENTSLFDMLNNIDDDMLTSSGEPVSWPVTIAGDKGYWAEWIDELFLAIGITPAIPSTKNEDCDARMVELDPDIYRPRNIADRLVEGMSMCLRTLQKDRHHFRRG